MNTVPEDQYFSVTNTFVDYLKSTLKLSENAAIAMVATLVTNRIASRSGR